MSSEFHRYTREEFLGEFFPEPADKAEIAAGMERLRAEQRAFRLAEMRRRLGVTQDEVAERMGVTQDRVSAIEHARPRVRPNCGRWPPTLKLSAAAWRSSPTSATSASPSPNPAPRQRKRLTGTISQLRDPGKVIGPTV